MEVNLNVNNREYKLDVSPNEKLLDTLRERLQILSVKRGCENGDCGACTVLVDRAPVASCIYLTAKACGHQILTIEAFGKPGHLHPLQEKFKEFGAFQCGFCAPGITLSAISLLDKNPSPTEEEIREAIYGNLCRCTGYVQIIQAIKAYVKDQGDGHEAQEI